MGCVVMLFTGEAISDETLTDSEFGVETQALRLKRNTEYYQWDEDVKTRTEKKLGGGEETVKTYTYTKKWVSRPIDSTRFERPAGHENPPAAMEAQTLTAESITVGGFTLSSGLKAKIDNFSDLAVGDEVQVPEQVSGKKVHRQGSAFYLGEKPSSPEVGDVRVKHEVALPGEVSVIAKQVGNRLEPFKADAGGTIEMLETGIQSAQSMFQAAHQRNKLLTWGLRLLGAVLMFFGFNLLFRPLSVLADVVPLFGTIVGAGTGIIAFLLTVVISFFVISVAWIYYRPLVGIPLMLVSVVGLYFLIKKLAAQKRKQAPVALS